MRHKNKVVHVFTILMTLSIGISFTASVDAARKGKGPKEKPGLTCQTTDNDEVIEEIIVMRLPDDLGDGQSNPDTYYDDNDGDGYLISGAASIEACEPQGDYQTITPEDGLDCHDTNDAGMSGFCEK